MAKTRQDALRLLEELKKDFPTCRVDKLSTSNRVYITLPPKIEKVPVILDIDKDIRLLERTIELAQRMAISFVREAIDTIADQIANKLTSKVPTQQVLIKEITSSIAQETKEKFSFKESELSFNVKNDLKLIGGIGQELNKKDNISNDLAALEKLDLKDQK
jgi:hypothetical protein